MILGQGFFKVIFEFGVYTDGKSPVNENRLEGGVTPCVSKKEVSIPLL